VKSCLRQHTIKDYLAGQVAYNLGEYPRRVALAPTEYDRQLLTELADHGVSLIGFHEEWNDPLRVFGADKFSSPDPNGLRAFVDFVHSLGMKLTLYTSTGWFDVRDPDFRPEWTSCDFMLHDLFYKLALCSPASPEWRAYLLPRLTRILDEYGVDGLFNDAGYEPLWQHAFMATRELASIEPYVPLPFRPNAVRRHVSPAAETPSREAAFEDLLGIVYEMIHRRGGVYRLHAGGMRRPPFQSKVYDYLWVGEGSADFDQLHDATMNHEPYVVPCADLSFLRWENEDDFYLYSVPVMQFPLRVDGRPCTGERAFVAGVEYAPCTPGRPDAQHHFAEIRDHYRQHPEADPCFGQWDSCPGRPQGRSRWLDHLALYLPMVKEGTRVWIHVGESALFRRPLAAGVCASLFVNDETYLVLANYARVPVEIATVWRWRDREQSHTGSVWTIPPRDLLFLQRECGDA